MSKRTPLYDEHVASGGKMVEFGGWDMPLHYGSQLKEHEAVRTDWGIFDVSHMTVIDINGTDARGYLQRLVANDVARLDRPGKALYGAMLDADGGVVDDLIVYRMQDGYRCVVNAATREQDLAWMQANQAGDVQLAERDLAMIAVQGPGAVARFSSVSAVAGVADLSSFFAVISGEWMVARTGYTGEDGVEVTLPGSDAVDLWRQLMGAGATPVGLGARDTLRLEAGLSLYGQDLDRQHSPLSSNIGWTVAWEPASRAFIGREALEAERKQRDAKLVGLVMRERAVLRHGQRVVAGSGEGVITSGTFSPTMQCSIALARVPMDTGSQCEVDIRGKLRSAQVVKPPFVRHGKVLVQ